MNGIILPSMYIFALHFASRVHAVKSELSELVAFKFSFHSLLQSETTSTVFCTFLSASAIVSPAPCALYTNIVRKESIQSFLWQYLCEVVDVENEQYWSKNRTLWKTLSHRSGVTEFVVESYFGLSVL